MTTKTRVRAKTTLEKQLGTLTLGNFLQALRKSEDWSQSDLAERLGVSKAHICDIEKERKGLSAKRAAEFANKLGYPQAQFVRLALQHQLAQAGLALKVDVRAA